MVEDDAFGYKTVAGPQFSVALHRALPNKAAGLMFFRFAPLFDHTGQFAIANRSMGTGIAYTTPTTEIGSALSINLEFEFISIPLPTTIQASSSATLALGLTL